MKKVAWLLIPVAPALLLVYVACTSNAKSAEASSIALSRGRNGEREHTNVGVLADRCIPVRLVTEDYLLHVKSPLVSSLGQEAVIDIHRVRPIYDDNTERDDKQMPTRRQVNPRECRRLNSQAERAVIMLHGRTVDAVAAFDPGIEGYNLQRTIANAGFDTYAMNLLGYGLSSRFSMENPCSASNKWDISLVERNPL